jgi:hypothetical protein
MRCRRRIVNTIIVVSILTANLVGAQGVTKLDGVFFGDYNYIVKNHDRTQEDLNDFSIRRYYFSFENNLTATLKTRFRLESANDKFGSGTKLIPFVKHAYLEWTGLIPGNALYLGISETNGFKNSETWWGYRSVEKTIMDLNKVGSSADMGIALKGDLSETLHHWLTIQNGPGYSSSEVDKYKKIGYALWITPAENMIVEAYADYEKQNPDDNKFKTAKDYTGSKGYYTLKAFLGYSAPSYTIGAEVFQRTNQESGLTGVTLADGTITSSEKSDVKKSGFSLFGSWITPIPKVKVFGRYDYFDPNTGNSVVTAFSEGKLTKGKDDETTLIIAGLDYIPTGNVHLMPNILYQTYTQSGKDADLTARMTFYFKFDSGKIIGE